MLRLTLLVAAVGLAINPAPSTAAPLQPTGKWVMDYTPTTCEAKRQFGDVAMAIAPGPLGQSTRLLIELPGKAFRARQFPARVDPNDGRGSAKATALLYPAKKEGMRRLFAVLPNTLVERAMTSGSINIWIGSAPETGRVQANSARANLALGPTTALRKALDTCMADLRKTWGMVDGKLPVPAKASQAQGDVRGIFRYTDYPEDALAANQSGTARYLLMIGRDGSVMDCVVSESSGVASLDVMGCQVIRERARFKPAIDANGKPALDTYMTPPISWKLG